jgi:hypothetical protein
LAIFHPSNYIFPRKIVRYYGNINERKSRTSRTHRGDEELTKYFNWKTKGKAIWDA